MSALRLRLAGALVLITCATAHAGVEARTFPLLPATGPAATAGALRPAPDALADLALLQQVLLVDVALPGGALVALELQRVPVASAGAALLVDGVPQLEALDAGVTLWSGRVAGDARSEAFLGFSLQGSRGWVRTGGELYHLVARPGADGAWDASVSSWTTESALRAAGARPPLECGAMDVTSRSAPSLPRVAGSQPVTAEGTLLPILECHLIVETDFQYFQLFNNLAAAKAYALQLLGAVSARYREQIGTILTIPYLQLYSTAADPWVSPDIGGCFDVLFEFQSAWGVGFGGSPPVVGDLYHFLSGADLGCGVAYLPGLCDQDYGFGVSGNLHGQTPFPIAVSPLNWDFIVSAHEMGHNFNAPHTHDYCPPLDQCAPDGYFGQCQTQQVCTSQGTLMSYCHLCDGGYENETTFFHPTSAADMRAYAEGCLQPFEGVLVQDLGFAKAGAGGTPTLSISYTASPDTLHVNAATLPAGKPGTLFLSTTLLLAPFKGGVLVPDASFMVPLVAPPGGTLALPLPVTFSVPSGLVAYAQEWFKDTGPGYAATNGLRFELIVP